MEAANRIVSILLESDLPTDLKSYVMAGSWLKSIDGTGNDPAFSVYDMQGRYLGHVGYVSPESRNFFGLNRNSNKDYVWYGYPRFNYEMRFFKTRDEAQRYVEKSSVFG